MSKVFKQKAICPLCGGQIARKKHFIDELDQVEKTDFPICLSCNREYDLCIDTEELILEMELIEQC